MSDETFSAVMHVITQIATGLNESETEGVEETLSRLAERDISHVAYHPPEPLPKPVTRYLSTAISAVAPWNVQLSRALAAVTDQVRRLQSAS